MQPHLTPPRRRRRRPTFVLLAATLAGALVAPPSASAASPVAPAGRLPVQVTVPGTPPSGRLIVRYRQGTSAPERVAARSRAGVRFERALRLIDADVVRAEASDLTATIAALRADPDVLSVAEDQPLHLDADPWTEPVFPYQWGLENDGTPDIPGLTAKVDQDIDAVAAWPTATGAGVVVAVLDDGVDFGHPELASQAWVNPDEIPDNDTDDDGNGWVDDVSGANICHSQANPADDATLHVPGNDFHGTAVSSVIAAAVNGSGMTGIAPDARIMGIRFLTGNCAFESYAITALEYAVGEGAKIVNASWGGSAVTPMLDLAIGEARDAGVLFVAASGNQGTSTKHWPAASNQPNVLSVGALRADGQYAAFANYGTWVDIAAPGVAIVAARADADDLGLADGTSFAAPYVAGVAALVAQAEPALLGDPIALRAKVIRSGWRGGTSVAAKTGFDRVLSAEYALDFAPPVQGTASTATPRLNDTMGSSTVMTHMVWPYATDDEHIDSYRVRVRRVGGDWFWITHGTTSRYVDRSLTIAASYQLEIFARDAGGNETSFVMPVRLVRSQESTPAAAYTGSWHQVSSSTASNSGLRYSTRIGDRVTFAFTGRGVALVAPRSSGRGTAQVFVDDVFVKTISLYATSSQGRRVVFSHVWPDAGAHTVRFVLAGPASRARFDVDAFVVTQ
jgi:subtilisin family serine protease